MVKNDQKLVYEQPLSLKYKYGSVASLFEAVPNKQTNKQTDK